jgi:hydrocephalus-inducing protein
MSKVDWDNTNEKLKEHDATVFFPLPDGTAKMFKIIGISKKPSEQEQINVEVITREWTPIKLNISNWLYQNQKFKVLWNEPEQGIFIKGANTINIASNSTKEYKLMFKSLKEGNTSFKITFENDSTKEFIFYTVNVKMNPPNDLPATELIGPIREIVTGSFTISNPLNTNITITESMINIDNEYLTITPKEIIIPAESESTVDVSYRPLLLGKTVSNIKITSPELGTLKYPITIEGTPTQPKILPPITACLGSDKIVQIYFTHYLKKPSTYTIKVEKYADGIPFADFIPEVATLNVDPSKGSAENSFNLKYEPSNIIESKGILKVTSPDGGEFQWVLKGIPSFPQAQGPYKVPSGKNYPLEFKNPLNEAVEINVRFDNPNFGVAGGKINNKLEAKKVLNVPISYKVVNPELGNTGRCIITVNKLPSWVYYLSTE